MPEIPDLEVIKDFLNERIAGKAITRVEAPRQWIVRSLVEDDFVADIAGRSFGRILRRGKDLLFPLDPDRLLVMNLMLTGHIQYCDPAEKRSKRMYFLLGTDDADLRYLDDRQMGLIYYLRPDQIGQIKRLHEQGPDALDSELSFDEFKALIKPYTGEIKGVLARGKFLSGIGNAYVDEILWAAQVSPFRKRSTLSEDDLRSVYDAVPQVLREATEVVRDCMPPNIHVKVRDFLQVHRKGGEPCPRCGTIVSEITPNKRITSWCRTCQPGGLVKN
jgi:formamidopyrimidine-DNA glycosylase